MRALVVTIVLLVAPVAHADVIPDCPAGQHFQANPVLEGAMHHSGGSCVDDPGGGGCTTAGRGSPAAWAVLGAAALVASMRRRR